MVLQTVPMFTCLFAYWLLGERIKCHEVLMILLAFVAISMMIAGGTDDSSSVKGGNKFATIMLIFNPILIATGVICMRSLRKTNEWVVSACSNLF